jgi:lipoprotein-releasing system permease protein
MPLELDVALAYLRSRPSRLVSAVSLLSIVGIALGVAALVVAMGLLSGYRAEIRDKLLGANAEFVVYPLAPAEGSDIEALRRRLSALPGVAATAAVVYQAGLAASERSPDGVDVVLKGIDPESEARVSPQFESYLPGAAAALAPVPGLPPSVALGEELARRLDVRPGGAITISVADASGGEPRFVPRTGRFRVARTFRTNFAEYDSEWIFCDRETLRALSRTPGAANVVEVKLGRPGDRRAVSRAIGQAAGKNFSIADTLSMNSGLFAALKVQQTTLFLVIGLIVGVSTFNVVGTIVMTVQEKKRDIGILSSLGAEPGFFTRVFLWFGGLLGGVGILAGVAFGSLVCWAVTTFRLLSFPPGIAQIYFVSYIPFRVRLEDLLPIVACSCLVILIASWLSARRAARMEIAEALRYE